MIREIGKYIESKTGVYIYPRFVISIIALLIALVVLWAAFFAVRLYRESIKTTGPGSGAALDEYNARMRAGLLPPTTIEP